MTKNKIWKRCLSFFCALLFCFTILIGSVSPKANALAPAVISIGQQIVSSPVGQAAAAYVAVSALDALLNFGDRVGSLYDRVIGDDSAQYENNYENYVETINNDYSTTNYNISRGSYFLPVTYSSVSGSYADSFEYSISGATISFSGYDSQNTRSSTITGSSIPSTDPNYYSSTKIIAPITGTYLFAYVGSLHNCLAYNDDSSGTPDAYASGAQITVPNFVIKSDSDLYNDWFNGSGMYGFWVSPADWGGVTNNYDVDITDSSTRFGDFSGNWAYVNGDGDVTVVENQQIINEAAETVYDPASGTTYNVDNLVYDYATRTYTYDYSVTDESTQETTTYNGSVMYGDEYMSITNDNTTNNYYYLVVDDSGGGSGGGSGETEAPSNFLTNMIARLGMAVSNITSLASGFAEAVADMFTWMPEEIQTLIVGALSVVLIVAFVKFLT